MAVIKVLMLTIRAGRYSGGSISHEEEEGKWEEEGGVTRVGGLIS